MAVERQGARAVMTVRPSHFGWNPETAGTNAFQNAAETDVSIQARQEFDEAVARLLEVGIRVAVCADDPAARTPDAVFPNNWVSFHGDGTVILYPMMAANRRREVREDLVRAAAVDLDFQVARVLDWTDYARQGWFLEGTGSLVLDRPNRVAYACLSERTHEPMLEVFQEAMDYDVVPFHARDPKGRPVYHTNVMMFVGTQVAAVCLDVMGEADRAAVREHLEAAGHEVLPLRWGQVERYAGNVLELENARGERFFVLSERARRALTDAQRATLDEHGQILALDLPTIETYGGGSARCLLAEVHLRPTA
jgi:hypothetical protein